MSGLYDAILACTYCAAQDSSDTINEALIPLGLLICIPYILVGIFTLILKNLSNENNLNTPNKR